MPNWCNNIATLHHEDPQMILRAVAAFTRGELLQELVPMPAELDGTTSPSNDNESWYDWRINNWGTKWDVDGEVNYQDTNMVTFDFQSAWAPPLEAYRRFSALGFDVTGFYYEPGMAFCGCYTSEGDDNYFDIQGGSVWVRENIPEDINEAFSISEELEMWEEDEEVDN